MTLTLRYMRPGDVVAVTALERQNFTPPWSAGSFHFEIEQSLCSYMVLLEHSGPPAAAPARTPWQRLWQQWQRWRGQRPLAAPAGTIMGYGGMWKIEEEAHISTIASNAAYRGHSYGEIVLAGMVRRAIHLGAGYIVLEVRVSNAVAIRLYEKYLFQQMDIKPGYYQSNGEDAYDMRVRLDVPANREKLLALYAAVQARVPFVDDFSTTRHPRLGL
ncbi:MAG: GNAT family N-acetyltransferase [Anaerolineae bacterium]|nr:GNAT family N-acetyltransferase [Anaerolineae bacterium]